MNKENIVGGEFAIEQTWLTGTADSSILTEYRYSSGRCALYAVLASIEKRIGHKGTIMLPNYLCSVITQTVIDIDWKYSFYEIKPDLHVNSDLICSAIKTQEVDAVLLIDYFGMTDISDDIRLIKEINSQVKIIADAVQAFYTKEKYMMADFVFTSLRKWFPCPDGASALAPNEEVADLVLCENNFAKLKLEGNLAKTNKSIMNDDQILDCLNRGERILDSDYIVKSSAESGMILSSIDKEEVAVKRKNNAKILHSGLCEMGIKHIYNEGVPLFIPIIMENRDSFRKKMFEENIFTPIHWPRMNEQLSGNNAMYDMELSLICDQRYGEEEMRRQLGVIQDFLN